MPRTLYSPAGPEAEARASKRKHCELFFSGAPLLVSRGIPGLVDDGHVDVGAAPRGRVDEALQGQGDARRVVVVLCAGRRAVLLGHPDEHSVELESYDRPLI